MMTDIPIEWRVIPEWPDYEASSVGGIRRRITSAGTYAGRVLSMPIDKVYRRGVFTSHGKRDHVAVHILVCLAFHGPRLPGLFVRHLDGDCLNNCASNLMWGTSKENADDRTLHGTDHQANKTHCAQGHPFTGANLRLVDGAPNRRMCRECSRIASQRRRDARKAAGLPARECRAR